MCFSFCTLFIKQCFLDCFTHSQKIVLYLLLPSLYLSSFIYQCPSHILLLEYFLIYISAPSREFLHQIRRLGLRKEKCVGLTGRITFSSLLFFVMTIIHNLYFKFVIKIKFKYFYQ